ncbi:MAG: 50S ribosomal protein L18 [Puniceicoccales bacterium]|jgi:large subunit ribosomal protein L18|nr:50S ribosomal protein L18 [Puniceicoccales bacterium]
MNKTLKKLDLARKRHWRLRKKVAGTAERPRLSVKFTQLHIYAQAIDDDEGRTLVAGATTQKDLRDRKFRPNKTGAEAFGKLVGEKIKSAGIGAVVFDRGSRQYHGTVKAFADAVRAAGVQF